MVSRFHFWFRIGIIAAALGCGVSVASAQGDGRYGGNRRGGNPTCGNELWCGGNSARTFRRPSWDSTGRRVDRIRPRQYRGERPIRPNYRPYRPRYYDYDGGSDIYLDFSGPSAIAATSRSIRGARIAGQRCRWRTSSGATTAIGPIANPTTHTCGAAACARSATRLIADRESV